MRRTSNGHGRPAVAARLRAGSDEGLVVVGWLTRIVAGIAIVGVVGFDAIAIGAADLRLTDDASAAAREANRAWNESRGDTQLAYNAAASYAAEKGATLVTKSFRVAPDGSVHLKLKKDAHTLLARHIGALDDAVLVEAEGDATTPAP